MKKKSKAFDYTTILKYVSILFCFLCLNKLEPTIYPYCTACYSSFIALGSNFISTSIIYLCSFIILNRPGLIASSAISIGVLFFIKLIRLKFKSNTKSEYAFFTAIALFGFIFLGDTQLQIQMEKRILCLLLSSVFTLIFTTSLYAIEKKGFKYKLNPEEVIALISTLTILGIGLSNLVSPILWKGLSVFIILSTVYLFKSGVAVTISACLGLSLSIYYGDVSYVAIFVVWGLVAQAFLPWSRYISAFGIVLSDFLLHVLFSFYNNYGIYELLPLLSSVLLYCIIPTKAYANLKDKLCFFNEKQLIRQTINRTRLNLSNKLYELSSVFTEMSNAFGAFKKSEMSSEKIKENTITQIKNNVCSACNKKNYCKNNLNNISIGISKMIDIGLAKGKLSLIDVPEELSNYCLHPNDVIYAVNRFLAEYRSYRLSALNLSNSRQIVAKEAEGVAEILRGLALESGTTLRYQTKLEKALANELMKKGFLVSEILIYGEEKRINVSLILTMKEFSLNTLQLCIGRVLKIEVILCEKHNITEDKVYLAFKKRVEFDAVFGVSNVKKDGSLISGDTHSVLRLSDDKFLVALSDGMGSGEKAESISSVSLSLIESFYKAGMNSNLILTTVNKLLSINVEESFTALDVAVINLKERVADFIKYGAPYGFIINDGAVKIIEGNTLPLGILEELAPSVAQTEVHDGDMIVLVTDGISDSFGSSSSIIDFLRTVPAKNPQTLTNQLLAKAISLSDGKHNDDMTALAVRIFKN